ncbi:Anhydro-N-acetylmuramic acid kinase [Methylophilaceae bacterium]|nr:Anhydro-N-acetylmuramic acid kinase [Methylophilaceae bacterium]
MSGTSLDGVDAVLLAIDGERYQILGTQTTPFTAALRQDLLTLHEAGHNELERSALIANTLSNTYAQAVRHLLENCGIKNSGIKAIGCHGQTIRHRPEFGFTIQIGNPSLLAELTGITVVADFRSRDIAAGGQGAPLVPAFHHAAFGHAGLDRILINIGGIANLTYLPAEGPVIGFDSGPGNMLMDAWIERQLGRHYDENGMWAASGEVIQPLLQELLAESFFALAPPKSTGRDLFNLSWLLPRLRTEYKAEDVQRTLLELTAQTIAAAIRDYCPKADEIYLCGGGAHNLALLKRLQQLLQPVKIGLSDELGISVNWVEAAAFAWLAQQTLKQCPGNLPDVTGAKGPRILGAIYAC